jgi:HEAT repeat protein
MKTTRTPTSLRILAVLAVLIPMLLAAGTALADDEERLEAARAALNKARYSDAALLFAEARERAQAERTAAEATYWEAFARYRTERTDELKESLELLRLHAERYADYATAAEAEALAARVQGELARRGAGGARGIYERAEKERQREETRIAALHALMQMDEERALPILEKIVRNEQESSSELRRSALFMLCQTGDDGVDVLLDVLPTLTDPEMIQTAVICLGQADSEKAHQALVGLARTSDDPEVLSVAMMALGNSSHGDAAFALLGEVARDRSRDPEVRSHAIIGLMQAEYPGTTELLLEIIRDRDEDEQVLETAFMALSRIDEPAAGDALLDMARDPDVDDEMRAQAIFMAGVHGRIDARELKEIYASAESRDLKVQICHVLAQLDDQDEAFDVMMEILDAEQDPEVRSDAVFWIGQFDDPRAAEYLLKIIDEE